MHQQESSTSKRAIAANSVNISQKRSLHHPTADQLFISESPPRRNKYMSHPFAGLDLARHSTKIYSFFGFIPGHTPPLNGILPTTNPQTKTKQPNGHTIAPEKARPKSALSLTGRLGWDLRSFGPVWYFPFPLSPLPSCSPKQEKLNRK